MNTSITTFDENPQSSILNVPWTVALRIVVIPGDSASQYNATAQVEIYQERLKAGVRKRGP